MWKGSILYVSNSMTFYKGTLMETGKRSLVAWAVWGGLNRQSRECALCGTVLMGTCRPTLAQTHGKRKPDVNISGTLAMGILRYFGWWASDDYDESRTFLRDDYSFTLVGLILCETP